MLIKKRKRGVYTVEDMKARNKYMNMEREKKNNMIQNADDGRAIKETGSDEKIKRGKQ